MNWLGDEPLATAVPPAGLEVWARVRSSRPPRPARLMHRSDVTSVELGEGEAGIAPGQACVLYDADGDDARILGGGFIDRSERGKAAEAMLARLASEPALPLS